MIPVVKRFFWELCQFSTGISPATRPYFVSCEVTFRCNLRCEFCNIPDFNPIQNEASTNVMAERLEESYRLGCRVISFTGGEPLLRADIGELADRCCDLGYYTGLVTNGFLLDRYAGEEWLHRIDAPAISFLASEDAFNRSRRVTDAHAIVSRNIRTAVDHGLAPILFCTLSADTLPYAETTAAFAQSLGLNVYFSLVQRAPREEYDLVDYERIAVADMQTAIGQLDALRQEYSGVRFDPDFLRMQAAGGFNDVIDCRAAQTVVCIKPDGSVALPCPHRTLLSVPPGEPLQAHWTGSRAASIRRARGTMPFCKNCQQNCMYLPSLIGHPLMLARWLRHTGL